MSKRVKQKTKPSNNAVMLATERFTLENLHNILDELEWDGRSEFPSSKSMCVKHIMTDLHERGVPDGELSDLLFDICILLGFLDEDGNELEQEGGTTDQDAELPDVLPQCWGYADGANVACKRCSIMIACQEVRKKSRPICFGKSYSSESAECSICLEWEECQEALVS